MGRSFVIPSIFTAVDRFTAPLEKMGRAVGAFGEKTEQAAARIDRRFRKIGDAAESVSKKSLVIGVALTAPLLLAANAAVKFEDKLTDVAKTTGLADGELNAFGKDILKMSGNTRTSIDDLLKISEIGGQLGIAKKELIPFTESVNKFNVALGKDFGGGVEEAATSIGKIRALFKETRGINVAESITKTGSAINELGAQGAGTSANITDFVLRVGALPDALKPGLQSTLALGTLLEEAGVNAEIGAGGITKFLLDAGNHMAGFAKQMGISKAAAQQLLAEDPTAFVVKFATSLNKLSPEKLAKQLKILGIGSQESIKVLGAVGAQSERLGELMNISNKAFSEGISLTEEYNKKNENSAANFAKAKNKLNELTIVMGEKLLPVINKVLGRLIPVIDRVVKWTERNPELTKTLLIVVGSMAALSFAVSGIAGAIAIASKAMLVFNFIMSMNPIGLIIIAIAALIALLVAVVKYWNDWGAVVAAFLGPIGWVISAVQSFRRNWDMIKAAFKNDGIISGLLAIGKTLLDVVLMPLQQIMKIVGNLTGWNWAKNAEAGIDKFRAKIGVNTTTDESGAALVNPKAAEQKALIQKMDQTNNAKVDINIKDPNNRTMAESKDPFVKINTSSTMAIGTW